MRRILHVDMDAFFAAVELRRHPELRGRPLVVGGRGDPFARGVVSTASYEARAFGIHSAMPLRSAYRLCPEAVFLPVDMEAYADVSAQVKAVLHTITPCVEDMGIDEAFLDISDLPEPPAAIARRIKEHIRRAEGLTCSIGIAPNKLLAKIASDMDKPDGLTLIAEDDIPTRIWPLPVRRLSGVGPKTEAHLMALGVNTIGDLAALTPAALKAEFGPAHGQYLCAASRGIDESPLITHWEPKSRSREITFQRDIASRQALVQILKNLASAVVEEIQGEGYAGRSVTVKVRFSDFETHTRGRSLKTPTAALPLISATALECFGGMELRKPVRLLGIRLGDLQKAPMP